MTQREKKQLCLCAAQGLFLQQCSWAVVTCCFRAVPHQELKRVCCGFQQEKGQACFGTNNGWEPGQAQETISEYCKKPHPRSAEGRSRLSPRCVASGRATGKVCVCWVPVSVGSPLPQCPAQLDGAGRWVPRYPNTVPFALRAMPTHHAHSPGLAGVCSRVSVTLHQGKGIPKY